MKRWGLAAALVLLAACNTEREDKREEQPSIPVKIVNVEVKDVPLYIEAVGVIKPSMQVDIRPQVSGVLTGINIDEGALVSKGTLMFTIDPASYKYKLSEVDAQLEQDRATLNILKKRLDRFNHISNREIIPGKDWDDLEGQIVKCEASIRAGEAKVAAARLDVSRCRLSAPFTGYVGRISTDIGNLLVAGQTQPLTTLTNIDTVSVEFNLTEDEYVRISQTGNGEFNLTTLCKGCEGKGKLAYMEEIFDPSSGLMMARGEVKNEEHQFLPGQGVKVRLPLGMLPQAIVVSQKSIKFNQIGPYVYVVDEENIAKVRQVRLGKELGELLVIEDGLELGDRVVVEGHLRLNNGSKVEFKDEDVRP